MNDIVDNNDNDTINKNKTEQELYRLTITKRYYENTYSIYIYIIHTHTYTLVIFSVYPEVV